MQKFDNKLEVGGLAMIVNVTMEANTFLIGKVVTVEALVEPGAPWPSGMVPPDPDGDDFFNHSWFDNTSALVSGNVQDSEWCCPGYACFLASHLMPLPPIADDEFETTQELPEAHA